MSHLANFISCIKVALVTHKNDMVYKSAGRFFFIGLPKVLYTEGLISRYHFNKKPFFIKLVFKPNLISNIRMVSTPGRKVHVSIYKLKSMVYKNPRVIYILSTAVSGVISSNMAVKKNIGGEVLCSVHFV